jgi:hypothetical protein
MAGYLLAEMLFTCVDRLNTVMVLEQIPNEFST